MPPATRAPMPPRPLVLREELLAGPSLVVLTNEAGLHHVIGQVLSTCPVGPASRAQAAALATTWRSGALCRETAAWVWAGAVLEPPEVVEVGTDGSAVLLTALGVVPSSCLRTRSVRCAAGTSVLRIGGVAVTDPASTASECARLLPPGDARNCLLALDASGRVPLTTTRDLLDADTGARGRRRGLALVEELLALAVQTNKPDEGRAA